jgi:hypothetical protein
LFPIIHFDGIIRNSFLFIQAMLKDCHYLVDLETGLATEREPQYSQMTSEGETIFQVDFLDNAGYIRLLEEALQ